VAHARAPVVESLRSLPLFATLDDDALARVAAVATEVEVAAGHVLMDAGSEGSGLLVLQDGCAVVEIGGRTIDCKAGDFLGELALLVDGLMHTGRVRATTPVRCLAIGRADFNTLLDEQPRIAVYMLRVLAGRLAATDELLSRR